MGVQLVEPDGPEGRPDLLVDPLAVDLDGIQGEGRVEVLEPLVEQAADRGLLPRPWPSRWPRSWTRPFPPRSRPFARSGT